MSTSSLSLRSRSSRSSGATKSRAAARMEGGQGGSDQKVPDCPTARRWPTRWSFLRTSLASRSGVSHAANNAHGSIPCHSPPVHLPVPRKRFVGSLAPRSSELRTATDHPWSIINVPPPCLAAGRTLSQILAHHGNAGIVTEDTNRADDARSRLTLSNETPDTESAGDASPLQDVEAQMRRALGLNGIPRRPDAERATAPQPPRPTDRFGAGGPRRRFAQDGEIPVTVLHGRREHPADAPINRLEAAETAAAGERTAREQAERALAEAQATIRDLQTKLGHASLAQAELQAAVRGDQEAIAAIQAELGATRERLTTADAAREMLQQRLTETEEEYAEEQRARQQAERAQHAADAARTDAERRLGQLDLTVSGSAERRTPRHVRPPRGTDAAATQPRVTPRLGKAQPIAATAEPEPVQWWLLSPKKTQRR
jgi:hypothetical protein